MVSGTINLGSTPSESVFLGGGQSTIRLKGHICCPSFKRIRFFLVDSKVEVWRGGYDMVEDIGLDIFVRNPLGCGEKIEFDW